ncbi:ribulokinase [Catenulispora pinisilvae]|uniref:ribulokinase n=1 Tax=Catenulispora pinisilvae TaxID=2705253 RepID=UPI001892779E|nr:ribulokinase [Catenulispora pinisilvae]
MIVTANIDRYVVGVDFGTLSGRAVVVRVRDGAELGSAVTDYRHGVIDHLLPDGTGPLPPDWALQNPEDWREVLRGAVPAALAASEVDPAAVIGIAIDFTACTVLPTLADGTPLCELSGLTGEPHAWPKLWKHHAAQAQADRINALAVERGEPWARRYGGKQSSEWEFAKALQVLEEAPGIYERCERWIEAADWIVWELTGTESRNACTAGYKGIFQEGGYPAGDFLHALDPRFADFAATRLVHPDGLAPLGSRVGALTERAAEWTGLPAGIAVAAGNVDAHVTAPAARAVEPGKLLAIMGTSTCHVLNSPVLADVPGICGVVDGGITAGYYGYEAGQSAVGDIFAWWTQLTGRGHEELTAACADQPVGGHGLVALDWMGGNRSILVDHDLSGVIIGLTLATRPEEVYRALLEATAFGTRVIVEAFEAGGVGVAEFVVAGGLKRNSFLMQLYADILRRPVSVAVSDQAPALGSAIHAAVAAGAYPDVPTAAEAMGACESAAYVPDPARADAYDALFAEYRALHDAFGAAGGALHRLRKIRNAAIARADRPAQKGPVQ